ncbi:MAG: cytochrome-c peroxidase, partial [Leptospirillia bacterium]
MFSISTAGESRFSVRRLQALIALMVMVTMTFSPALGFAQVAPVFNDDILDGFVPPPLSSVPIPEPGNLGEFVADRTAAIQLGKALFWDMSVGSNGQQACASCHFHAGADKRDKNQLNPGINGFEVGNPNYPLAATDYPFVDFPVPSDRFILPRSRDMHDISGSQGVPNTEFRGATPGIPEETTVVIPDDVFHAPNGVGGPLVNTNRVTGRNTPSVINAAFNLRNFWDGRASASFNGVTPFGQHDPDAVVFVLDGAGNPVPTTVRIDLSSLASQAVGPPLSDVEMSAIGRTWPDIGHKLLPMQPLSQQMVDLTDSVLGTLATVPTGMTGTYADMVQAAFQPAYWNSATPIAINGGSYSMMEANFSLFFGLAIQLYEGTLISDDAKFDKVRRGDPGASFTANELRGLEIFTNIGQNPDPAIPVPFCAICHLGAEFTGAAFSQVGLAPLVLPGVPEVPEFLVERMQTGATIAQATLTMSSAPLPDQITFPADFPLDATSPLTQLIVLQAQPGDPTASGRWEIAFGDKLTQPGVITKGMEPQPELPNDPSATATLVVTADGEITFEVTTLNLPLGTYDVSAGGVGLGTVTSAPNMLYDLGFYNIGVTPSSDDLGLGAPGVNPDGDPLGMSAQILAGVDPAHTLEGVPDIINPLTGQPMTLEPALPSDTRALVDGAFKVPSLRNAELTAPYFHNGGKRTLCEVVNFYNRGGDFHAENANDLDPTILSLGMTDQDITDVVSFLLTLTDERVRNQSAPFDHPQLFVSNGHPGDDAATVDSDGDGIADDNMVEIPAVGAAGGAPIQGFLGGGAGACIDPAVPPTPPADADGDGVVDTADNCPNTPPGEAVDVNGCAASQVVCNDNDPSTADSYDVTTATCVFTPIPPVDADGDGVPDDGTDQCLNTPAGEPVDLNGCSASQVVCNDNDPSTADSYDV